MKLNKEGYSIIAVVFVAFAIVCALSFVWLSLTMAFIVAGLLLLSFLSVIVFFREPRRETVKNADFVYAPANGRVVVVEEITENEYLNERRIQVSVFMSLFDVHVNWYPVGGNVEYVKYHPGKFKVAWHPKSSEHNERTTIVINTGRNRIMFRQIAGFVARRIVFYAEIGKKVKQNTKCGFIKFGSRVDIMLPTDSEILVNIGDRVFGARTPIARLKQ